MRRVRLLLTELFAVALIGAGIVATLGFLKADTPAEAAQKNLARLPSVCEAGVLNHGTYYCWYTIREHPFWFALSVAAVMAGGFTVNWVHQRWQPSKNDA